jgi:hypothetical protein
MGSNQSTPKKPPTPHLLPGENEFIKNDPTSEYPTPTGHEYDMIDKIASAVSTFSSIHDYRKYVL